MLQQKAQSICDSVSDKCGFVVTLGLILGIIEAFNACWEFSRNQQEFRDWLQKQHNPQTGEFSTEAMTRGRRIAKHEARKRGERYTRDQLDDITRQSLLEAMNTPPEVMASCMAECSVSDYSESAEEEQ